MDLALALTGMTVGEMLERMSDRELDGWVAYAKKNGLPQKRQELYLAQVAQIHGGGKLDTYILRPAEKVAEEEMATRDDFLRAGGSNVIRISKG